jgi:hypothetical protein
MEEGWGLGARGGGWRSAKRRDALTLGEAYFFNATWKQSSDSWVVTAGSQMGLSVATRESRVATHLLE